MKKCPYCAEEIQDDAVKCRFCQADLVKKKMPVWQGCLIGCLAVFAGLVILSVLFSLLSFILLKLFVHKVSTTLQQYPNPFYFFRFPEQLDTMFKNFSGMLMEFLNRMMEIFNGNAGTKTL